MILRFTNWRRLDRPRATGSPSASYAEAVRMTRGVDGPAPPGSAGPALRCPEDLSAIEREQMVHGVRRLAAVDEGVALTFNDLFSARLAEVDRTGSFADDFEAASVEWWDVVDEQGIARYRLWLLGVGCGDLLEAESTRRLGYVNQYDLYPDEEPNPHAELWEALAAAKSEAERLFSRSELAEVAVPVD